MLPSLETLPSRSVGESPRAPHRGLLGTIRICLYAYLLEHQSTHLEHEGCHGALVVPWPSRTAAVVGPSLRGATKVLRAARTGGARSRP